MYSTKLSVSIHILCLIARQAPSPITSEGIAGSIGTNPALVRRLMGRLKKAGLIQTQTKLGATGLAKPADEISLCEVFHAVEPQQRIFDLHTGTNRNCYVGAHIEATMGKVFDQLQDSLEKQLGNITLSDILKDL